MNAVYLHGFASSPDSIKARYFRGLCEKAGVSFVAPDLNAPDFPSLTVSRMVAYALEAIQAQPGPVILFGSSMGGFAATVAAARAQKKVHALILFAPAFDLDALWRGRLNEKQIAAWREQDRLPLAEAAPGHPAYLRFDIFRDAESLRQTPLHAVAPTLIFHGEIDDTVPIATSRAFAAREKDVRLVAFPNAGHGLNDKLEEMGREVAPYFHA